MTAEPLSPREAGPNGLSPEAVRGVPARRGMARRIIRWIVLVGLLVLAAGFAVGLLAEGASVSATILLLVGLGIELVGLVTLRLTFWAGVYRKESPVVTRRVRKPGT